MFRKYGIWLILLLVLVAGGIGYAYYRKSQATTQTATEPSVQTSVVRRGSLIISANGSGSVIPVNQIELSFPQSGRLSELFIKTGNVVKAGDVLASLESSESANSLALKLSTAELAVLKAHQALDALYAPTDVSLAQAQVDLITAQETLNDLVADRQGMSESRCSSDTIREYQAEYDAAVRAYRQRSDTSNLQILNSALANLNWCEASYSEEEIANVDAQIQLVQTQVAELEQQIEQLKTGPDPDDVALAEAELANAQAQLKVTKEEIEKQQLIAPMDGTIMGVTANVGDLVGTSSIITLADLSQPMLEVFVDETDLNQLVVGYEVEVVFDALPEKTYTGHVVSVDPGLTTVNNVQAVRGLVQLDDGQIPTSQILPIGLNASVEIIGSKAEGVLLVPVEALREISPGKYGVFVMRDGEPRLQIVEVGLIDFTFAEIKSGLNEGDVVTTGVVETVQ